MNKEELKKKINELIELGIIEKKGEKIYFTDKFIQKLSTVLKNELIEHEKIEDAIISAIMLTLLYISGERGLDENRLYNYTEIIYTMIKLKLEKVM